MRKLLSSLIALACLTACNSGGSSGPTEPPPVTNVNIQGTWLGFASNLAARGTCLAESFLPVTVPVVWTIRQTNAAFTATEVLNGSQVCAFTGTVSGSTATFIPDLHNSDSVCSVQNLACAGPRAVRINLVTGRFAMTGSVSGNPPTQMTIASSTVWTVTETSSGNTLGDYDVTGRQDLRR